MMEIDQKENSHDGKYYSPSCATGERKQKKKRKNIA